MIFRKVNYKNQTIVTDQPAQLDEGWFRFIDLKTGLAWDYAEHTWTKKLAAFVWRLTCPGRKFSEVRKNVYEIE